MEKLNVFDTVSIVLVVIGGLNWGLVGLLNWNLVGLLFGEMSAPSRIVYVLVGLAAVYVAWLWTKLERK